MDNWAERRSTSRILHLETSSDFTCLCFLAAKVILSETSFSSNRRLQVQHHKLGRHGLQRGQAPTYRARTICSNVGFFVDFESPQSHRAEALLPVQRRRQHDVLRELQAVFLVEERSFLVKAASRTRAPPAIMKTISLSRIQPKS